MLIFFRPSTFPLTIVANESTVGIAGWRTKLTRRGGTEIATMTGTADKKSAYRIECERRCQWCAAGRGVALTFGKQRVHYIFIDPPWKYGARTWRDEPCTAPTELQLIEELAAKVAGLDRIIELQQTSIGICAESRDKFKHENRKLTAALASKETEKAR